MKLPNLKNADIISIDCETRDSSIAVKMGSGARRPGNYILGVSIAVPGMGEPFADTRAWYFPLAHPDSENIDSGKFFAWLNQYKTKTFIGANILYDLDYFQYQGFTPTGKIYDVQFAEPLLNENLKKYNLDSLYERHLGIHKAENNIQNICDANKWKGKPQEHLYKMKAADVAEYAIRDVKPLLQLFNKQKELLNKENLFSLFEMECSLIPILLNMRKLGVRINEDELNKTEKRYKRTINKKQKDLNSFCGMEINVNAHESLKKVFDKFGYTYPYTEKDNPSFGATFLNSHGSELAVRIMELKHYKKIHSTYLIGMQEHIVNGRIHCEFHPLRSDAYGTVSGRFSSSNMNLQQIPNENEKFKKDIRGLFLPEENCQWIKADYRQEEMAIFAHYARGTGAESLREMYRNDPEADLYIIMAQLGTGKKEIDKPTRQLWKRVSLGVLYGMGTEKLGRTLKIITEMNPGEIQIDKQLYCAIKKVKNPRKEIFTAQLWEIYWYNVYNGRNKLADIPKENWKFAGQYERAHGTLKAMHDKLPCLKETTKQCQTVCEQRGYVKTILGRKRRLTRAEAYKSFNAVDQGSGGDVMKAAMIAGYVAGIFNTLPLHLTVHDELDVSQPETKEGAEALRELKHTMENAVKLKVPLRCDIEIGETWGTVAKERI